MDLPFTTEQFLAVFETYNQAIWPAQVVAYLLGVGAIVLALKPFPGSGRIIGVILAGIWIWNGAVYHLAFFLQINAAAIVFGAVFIVQGLLFLVSVVRSPLLFRIRMNVPALVGGLLILYAMVVYPIIGSLLGHGYPSSPSFGVAPCPTTIFTFGLLLWAASPMRKLLLVIPLVWSVVGFAAAVSLGIREDIGLLVAGLVATAVITWRDWPLGVSGRLRVRHP